jgi:hypothetical protein
MAPEVFSTMIVLRTLLFAADIGTSRSSGVVLFFRIPATRDFFASSSAHGALQHLRLMEEDCGVLRSVVFSEDDGFRSVRCFGCHCHLSSHSLVIPLINRAV